MPTISLTDFVDFVAGVGPTKLTKVLEIKRRGDYLHRFDYYREIREGIIVFHAEPNRDKKKYFQSLLDGLDSTKRGSFQIIADTYQSFLGRKKIVSHAVENRKTIWRHKELKVRVNPELSLTINDKDYLLKLYFKAPSLTKSRVEVILLLMKHALPELGAAGITYGLLDARHGRLYDSPPQDKLLPLLHGEADSFLTMWNETI